MLHTLVLTASLALGAPGGMDVAAGTVPVFAAQRAIYPIALLMEPRKWGCPPRMQRAIQPDRSDLPERPEGCFAQIGPVPFSLYCARRTDDTTPADRQSDAPAQPAAEHEDLEELVARLEELGLHITADPKRIGAATSEAAYFMFADRKEHRPKCRPLEMPEKGHWLDGKSVFTSKADRDTIRPLFDRLVERMGYNEVCVYSADVRYGVNSHARFTLYKLGYRPDDERRGKQPEVLLGDAEYVLGL